MPKPQRRKTIWKFDKSTKLDCKPNSIRLIFNRIWVSGCEGQHNGLIEVYDFQLRQDKVISRKGPIFDVAEIQRDQVAVATNDGVFKIKRTANGKRQKKLCFFQSVARKIVIRGYNS